MLVKHVLKPCCQYAAGFVASGPIVVLAEAALQMGPNPSHIQQVLLFYLVAGLTLAGNCSVQSCAQSLPNKAHMCLMMIGAAEGVQAPLTILCVVLQPFALCVLILQTQCSLPDLQHLSCIV